MVSEFSVKLIGLADRASNAKNNLQSEHSTKSALVMPFIAALGYDVFDPLEVIPEYTADVGTKRGEKVDFAVIRDGNPVIIIECKPYGAVLDAGKCNQLFRYFIAKPTARIGILTNGTKYMFFTDLEKQNIMDQAPYMVFDLENLDKTLIPELAKLTKQGWNIDAILLAAADLKYSQAIKKILIEEFQSPSEEIIRFLAGKAYPGRLTQTVKGQFSVVVKRAFQDFLREQMTERFNAAVAGESSYAPGDIQPEPETKIKTTDDEWQAYYLVKSLIREVVDSKRIVMRDAQSYCAILLDDNNRKPICRLHFNANQKYVGLFDADKKEERVPITEIDDIFGLEDRLKGTVTHYG